MDFLQLETPRLSEWHIGKKDILVNIVDYMARKAPRALYAEFPLSPSSYTRGYRKINYGDLANAVNGVAWWLEKMLGKGKNFETLAYVGPNDMRYNVVILGAVKAGYKIFTTCPRNTVVAHTHLFKLLDCKAIITGDPPPPNLGEILTAYPLQALTAPSIQELLEIRYPHYPYNKTFEEAKHEPFLAYQSSSSTGMPKIYIWNHDYAASYIKMSQLEPPPGFDSTDQYHTGNRVFFMLTPFHASALTLTLCRAIGDRSTFIYPPASPPPTAKLLAEALQHTQVDCAFIPPHIAAELASNPELLDSVSSNLHSLFITGGDISESIGDKISKHTILVNTYSSSELISIPQLHPSHEYNPSEWKYLHFHPRMGVEFWNASEDIFELVMVRHQEFEDYQPVFKLYPEFQIFETGDLWSPHTSKEGLWRCRGREEDVIVFKGGERFIPLAVEGHIATHPEIKSALLVGTGREEAALMVELVSPEVLSGIEKLKAVERIWPIVHEANCLAHGFARVREENIIFVDQEKPMGRTPMGTVQRELTVRLYARELDALNGRASVLEEKECEIVMNEHVEEKSEPVINRHMENSKANVGRRGGRIGFFLS